MTEELQNKLIKKGYITGRYSSIPLRGSNLIEVLEEQVNEEN